MAVLYVNQYCCAARPAACLPDSSPFEAELQYLRRQWVKGVRDIFTRLSKIQSLFSLEFNILCIELILEDVAQHRLRSEDEVTYPDGAG
jgi:hypothetical protein